MKIRQLTESIGAEISDIQLDGLDEDEIAEVKKA